jgi:hypothetical protein
MIYKFLFYWRRGSFMSALPSVLYKYKKFDANSLDMLLTGKVFFSDPLKFNDSIDCYPKINVDVDYHKVREAVFQLKYRLLKKQVEATLADKNRSAQQSKILEDFCDKRAMALTDDALDLADEEEYESIVGKNLIKYLNPGVLSLSETPKSHLMWSHYGDEHRGFCLGYNANDTLANSIHKVKYKNKTDGVNVSDILFCLSENHKADDFHKVKNESLLYKLEGFKYEREWRYIKDGAGLTKTPMKLTEIIFGLNFKDSIKKLIIDQFKSSDITFKQVKRQNGKINLKLVTIEVK